MHKTKTDFIIFCDGACLGNPGPGGWGSIIVDLQQSRVLEIGGAESQTTNNKMEMTAAGRALRYLENRPGAVRLLTDSNYIVQGMNEWLPGWQKKNWKKSDGSEVANISFWKRLVELTAKRAEAVTWVHVKGHAGIPGNERCDEIATTLAKGSTLELFDGPLENYSVDIFQEK